ncbi:MAG: hypothetical protein AAB353_07875 [Candidatus Hydrogenedentota bacterium]
MVYVFYAVGAALALYGFHRLFLWMEERGWVYYWHKRGMGAAAGNAFITMQAFVEPEVQEAYAAREQAEERDFSGDPLDRYLKMDSSEPRELDHSSTHEKST